MGLSKHAKGRTSTIIAAPSDSSARGKVGADYVFDGINDDAIFQSIIDDLYQIKTPWVKLGVVNTDYQWCSIVYVPETSTYHMFGSDVVHIYRMTSTDGINFTDKTIILDLTIGGVQGWESGYLYCPKVWRDAGVWNVLYTTTGGGGIGFATSLDSGGSPGNFTKHVGNPVLTNATAGAWDSLNCPMEPMGIIKVGSTYYLHYNTLSPANGDREEGLATSTDRVTWTKDTRSPLYVSGRFCSEIFMDPTGTTYYMMVTHYTKETNGYATLELYSDTAPTFYPESRKFLGVAITESATGTDSVSLDVPQICTSDIQRKTYPPDGKFRCYYSGKDASSVWRIHLCQEDDFATAIGKVIPVPRGTIKLLEGNIQLTKFPRLSYPTILEGTMTKLNLSITGLTDTFGVGNYLKIKDIILQRVDSGGQTVAMSGEGHILENIIFNQVTIAVNMCINSELTKCVWNNCPQPVYVANSRNVLVQGVVRGSPGGQAAIKLINSQNCTVDVRNIGGNPQAIKLTSNSCGNIIRMDTAGQLALISADAGSNYNKLVNSKVNGPATVTDNGTGNTFTDYVVV